MEKHMFDKYFICDHTLKNIKQNNDVIGFGVDVKVSYYRGVTFATINDFKVSVDGKKYDRSQILFSINGTAYELDKMVGDTVHRWEFGEKATLLILEKGGLKPGEHEVSVREEIRIVNGMYIPEDIFVAEWTKNMELESDTSNEERIKRGISFYSFQDELYLGSMNLEQCIKKSTEWGAKGIEIISEANIPNFPNPSEEWIQNWFELMETYGTKPVCYDMFMDGQTYRGVDISDDQAIDIIKTNINLAAKLGFHIMRVVYTIPLNIIEKALAFAEEKNVVLGIEIHPPFHLHTEQVDQYVDFIKRTKTKYFGLIPDFGIFIKRPIPVLEKLAIERGAHKEVVKRICELYEAHCSYEVAFCEIEKMEHNHEDLKWLKEAFSYTYNEPDMLADYMNYVVHVHAKVYDMEDGIDPSVDNEKLFSILKSSGYTGYVCTEYEGQRIYHGLQDKAIDNLKLLKEHQKMMEQYICS